MQSLVKKATLAVVLCMSIGAQAQSSFTDLGIISGTISFQTGTAPGPFQDLYQFTVGGNAGTVISTQSFLFNGNGASVGFLRLYSGSYGDPAALGGLTPYAAGGTPAYQPALPFNLQTVSLSAGTLPAGSTYTLLVEGSSAGAGNYSGLVSLAPVPEPETYALLLAGLGMMATIAQRRRRNR